MLPLLRLVVGLVGALAGSGRVRAQGADFADQHTQALQRVMDDASSLGSRSAFHARRVRIGVRVEVVACQM